MDPSAPMPRVKAIGTEKIHGTNASVCYSIPDGFWVQSRKNIITPKQDNAGCALVAHQKENVWIGIITALAEEHGIDLNENIITVYFEWCGGSIQKKSAVSGMEKMAIIFRTFKVSPLLHGSEIGRWYETTSKGAWIDSTKDSIYNVSNFPTYEFEIDFADSHKSQERIMKIVTETIEPSSPIGESLGIVGNIGEGLVVSFTYEGGFCQFKVKGDKHANGGVKTPKIKKVDNEKAQNCEDLAIKVSPAWRLEQMFDEANDIVNGGKPGIENIRTFMKLLQEDIIKEESDIILEAGLVPKDIMPRACKVAKYYYLAKMEERKLEA